MAAVAVVLSRVSPSIKAHFPDRSHSQALGSPGSTMGTDQASDGRSRSQCCCRSGRAPAVSSPIQGEPPQSLLHRATVRWSISNRINDDSHHFSVHSNKNYTKLPFTLTYVLWEFKLSAVLKNDLEGVPEPRVSMHSHCARTLEQQPLCQNLHDLLLLSCSLKEYERSLITLTIYEIIPQEKFSIYV